MANRNLTQSAFRQVTKVVAEDTGSVVDSIAAVGKHILQQNEEAKVTENFSQLQLELGQLELENKTEFAGDPESGFRQFKQDRQKIIDNYAQNISPLYRGTWNKSIASLTERSDATQQKWVYTQSRKNSIASVNSTIENSINQAMRDGMAAGESGEDVDAFVNFADSYQNIERFATQNLGEGQSSSMLKNYEEDYIKSFVSGVSFSNPEKALQFLDDDDVKQAFNDVEQYTKMRDAVTKRRDRKVKADFQRQDAEVMSGTNALSVTARGMNYAELQMTFEKMGVSKEAQDFYMDVTGYTQKKRALTRGEKADLKNKFYIKLNDFIENDKVTMSDMQAFQDATYGAMTKGALSKNEGFELLNGLMEPLLEDQKERANAFETGEYNPFQENLGFDSLKLEVEKISGLFFGVDKDDEGEKLSDKELAELSEGQTSSLTEEQFYNLNRNKNLMYDVYLQSLASEAQNRGVTVTELGRLGRSEEVKIYNKALNEAKSALLNANFPSVPEGTNSVVQPIPDLNDIDAEIARLEKELGLSGK